VKRVSKSQHRADDSISEYDCIIVGGGPAGLVAAIYLLRYRRKVLLFDGGHSRALNIPKIRNLVGYSEGISGRHLLKRLRNQALKYNAKIMSGEATISRYRKIFNASLGERQFQAQFVILASGVEDRQPPRVEFNDLCKRGLLAYCPICDGFDHVNKQIGLIIDSPSGFKKIQFLYKFSRHLHFVVIRDLVIPARHVEKIKKYKVKVSKGHLEYMRPNRSGNKLEIKLKHQKKNNRGSGVCRNGDSRAR
jgi:thioredoxin reductase (NADPH)